MTQTWNSELYYNGSMHYRSLVKVVLFSSSSTFPGKKKHQHPSSAALFFITVLPCFIQVPHPSLWVPSKPRTLSARPSPWSGSHLRMMEALPSPATSWKNGTSPGQRGHAWRSWAPARPPARFRIFWKAPTTTSASALKTSTEPVSRWRRRRLSNPRVLLVSQMQLPSPSCIWWNWMESTVLPVLIFPLLVFHCH